jgi:hypothetical protein
MAHSIKLRKQHLQILLEVLTVSREYKMRNLRNPASKDIMIKQYRQAEDRLYSEIEIACGRKGWQASDNLFGYIRDQVYHSGKIADSELGKHAIAICEAAGGDSYEVYCSYTVFSAFFE